MRITWNGTGSAWATHFGNSSAIVEYDGMRLLIDCGHTVPGRLRAMQISLRDIDAVFISHLHGDHVFGLEEWGFRSMLIWKYKPRLFIAADLADTLWQHVLSGTMDRTCDRTCKLTDYFDVTRLHVGTTQAVGPLSLAIQPVRHIPHAHAYGLKVTAPAANVAVGFTCDSLADADPWFYEETACVFHDCSFHPYYPDTVHAHFEQLTQYPAAFRERMYLVHYDDDIREKREQADWQEKLATTTMRLAEPFQPISIG